jgi:hypothetical protein
VCVWGGGGAGGEGGLRFLGVHAGKEAVACNLEECGQTAWSGHVGAMASTVIAP